MEFDEAGKVFLPFGQYEDQAIDDVAKTDEGLRYLDWVITCVRAPRVKEALQIYLNDPTIAREVEAALEKRGE